jgi:hypothetical protein
LPTRFRMVLWIPSVHYANGLISYDCKRNRRASIVKQLHSFVWVVFKAGIVVNAIISVVLITLIGLGIVNISIEK